MKIPEHLNRKFNRAFNSSVITIAILFVMFSMVPIHGYPSCFVLVCLYVLTAITLYFVLDYKYSLKHYEETK